MEGIIGNPLVSVIVPAYNCERYLAEAIESALGQTHEPVEVLVIDDGSTDSTAAVAGSFATRVRYYHQANGGIGAARNRGAELADGELLAFLDADDRWVVDKLAMQIAALRTDPKLDMVFGQARQLHDGPEWERGVLEKQCPAADLMPGMVPGTLLLGRHSFWRVGAFRSDCKVGEFVDWYARATESGLRKLTLPNLLLWRRLHASNQGIRERQAVTDYARVLKAALDRRRAT
jgi:glycosyltransferase involved in cell wall biosynthesis